MNIKHPLVVSTRKKGFFVIMLWITFSIASPAQEFKDLASQTFHNTTSYYNGYFISKESLNTIYAHIVKQEVRNYEEVLPPYPPYDTLSLAEVKEDVEKCIEKPSLIIKWHPVSEWIDDAYLILGQGRMFKGDWDNAIETFRYVQSKSEDKGVRTQALIFLMQVYLYTDKLDQAQEVAQYIQRENPSDEENKLHFLRTQAQYMLQKEEYSAMIPLLEEALLLADKKHLRTRLHFILGQLYEREGDASAVHSHFSACLKDNTFYDMWIEAALKQLVNAPAPTAKAQKKIRKKFKRMLRERKHYELQHYIHYAWGHFEGLQEDIEASLRQYKAAARKSSGDALIGGRSYEHCARMYYEDKRDFVNASYYYDSAVSLLPEGTKGLEALQKRSEILQRFVKEYLTIQNQDSLLALAALSTEERKKLFDEYLAKEKEERKAAKKRRRHQSSQKATKIESRDIVLEKTGTWYFYNPTALSAGERDFQKVWGTRPLEDHWRRSQKTPSTQGDIGNIGDIKAKNVAASSSTSARGKNKDSKENEGTEDDLPDQQAWEATIPLTEQAQVAALKKIEDALFALGKIYYLELIEKREATETFVTLLERFPSSAHIPEALYILVQNDALDSAWREHYKQRLLSEYGESVYAHLVRNPRYLIEKATATRALQRAYDSAYTYARHNSIEHAHALLMQRQKEYADNSFSDNAKLFEILLMVREEPLYYYPMRLQRFLAQYPDSEVHAYATTLLEAAERLHEAYVYSSKPVYTRAKQEKYLFALHYSKDTLNSDTLRQDIQRFVEASTQKNSATHWIEKLSLRKGAELLMVVSFADLQEGLAFYKAFYADTTIKKRLEGAEDALQGFLITEKNMDMMYASKDLEVYLSFFEQYVKSE